MSETDDIVELMARAIVADIAQHGYCGDDGDGAVHDLTRVTVDCDVSAISLVRAALDAAEAAGYEIRKRDPGMIAIKEIETRTRIK